MRFMKDKRGDMAEAAITTPIVVLLFLALVNLAMAAYAAQAAQNAANYGARMGSVAQVNPAGVAYLAARRAAESSIVGDYEVQILAPGGVVGSELAVRVNWRVPNFLSSLAALFPGLPRGDFRGHATAIFRQEGW